MPGLLEDLPLHHAGGDAAGTATGTAALTAASTTAKFNITTDVQGWYNGNPNYGTLIKDQATNDGFTTVFGAKAASNATSPELDVTFVQNVTGLTATPGNGSVTLNWTIPAPIGTPVPGESYTGVVILDVVGSAALEEDAGIAREQLIEASDGLNRLIGR